MVLPEICLSHDNKIEKNGVCELKFDHFLEKKMAEPILKILKPFVET